MSILRSRLVDGDPLDPSPGDVIVQFDTLVVGKPVPKGWRVLSGNVHSSTIARVVQRYELEIEGEN